MVPTVRGGQGKSGSFKKSGKSHGKSGKMERVRESQGIL